jgi:hypothetical protein
MREEALREDDRVLAVPVKTRYGMNALSRASRGLQPSRWNAGGSSSERLGADASDEAIARQLR